jgi:hypothetical protein
MQMIGSSSAAGEIYPPELITALGISVLKPSVIG